MINKKTLIIVLLIIVTGLLLVSPIYAQKAYSLKMAHHNAKGSIRDLMAEKFKEVVEEKSNGRITVKIFSGGTLGGEFELVEQVQAGAVDFALPGSIAMDQMIPEYDVLLLPFLFKSRSDVRALMESELHQEWDEKAENFGLKVLGNGSMGFSQMTNNVRPINHPDDLKGVKMRSAQLEVSIRLLEALGATVTVIPYGELYLALQQGVVDGQHNPVSAVVASSFYEVQDYLSMTNHFFYDTNIIMNLKLWEEMDLESQKIILDAASQAGNLSWEIEEDIENDGLALVKEAGMEIAYPDTVPFREKCQSVYDGIEKIIGKDTMRKVLEFIDSLQ